MSNNEPKNAEPKTDAKDEASTTEELSEEQLEQVAGGALNAYRVASEVQDKWDKTIATSPVDELFKKG